MRELSMNEVDEVSGGVPQFWLGVAASLVAQGIYDSVQLALDAFSETPTGPSSGHTGIGACDGGCHGG